MYGKAFAQLLVVVSLAAMGACSTVRTPPPPSEQYASADPAPGDARSDRPMTIAVNNLSWLAANSPFVFVGRLSSRAIEQDVRGLIVTRNRFEVERVIVGEPSIRAVDLTIFGGSLDGLAMRVSHMPEFAPDQRYVIFTDLKRTVYNPVTGNQHGVFIVAGEAVYGYDGQALTGIDQGLLRFGEDAIDRPQPGHIVEGRAAAEPPKTTGNVVSAEPIEAERAAPMRLDDFLRAIAAAARR